MRRPSSVGSSLRVGSGLVMKKLPSLVFPGEGYRVRVFGLRYPNPNLHPHPSPNPRVTRAALVCAASPAGVLRLRPREELTCSGFGFGLGSGFGSGLANPNPKQGPRLRAREQLPRRARLPLLATLRRLLLPPLNLG